MRSQQAVHSRLNSINGMRIGFVTAYPHLASIPAVVVLLEAILGQGFEVDWIAPPLPAGERSIAAVSTISFFALESENGTGTFVRLREFARWCKVIRRLARDRCWDILVGIDQTGLSVARFGVSARTRFYYLSLELLFWNELRHPRFFLMKAGESLALRRVKGVIIQDSTRGEALRRGCGLRSLRIWELPNSWPGGVLKHDRDVIRKRLGLANNIPVILHVGSCSAWTCVPDLIEAILGASEDLAFVIKARDCISSVSQRMEQTARQGRLHFLDSAMSPEELGRFSAGADVGLAFYSPQASPILGRNIIIAGKSSGKVSTYLQSGVPIVCSKVGGIASIVERYQAGVAVDSPAKVVEGIRVVLKDQAHFAAGAHHCFTEEFANGRFLPAIINELITVNRKI